VYTQCSKCETVFKLSAEVLRTAGGQVRCGRCGEVFNALARLAEDSSAFAMTESPLDLEERADSILESVATLQVAREVAKDNEEFVPPGVEIARLEVLDWPEEDAEQSNITVQADVPTTPQTLEPAPDGGSAHAPAVDAPPGPGTETSTDADPAAAVAQTTQEFDDRSLEFTLPPGELDRIFVESKKRAAKPPLEPILQPEARVPPKPPPPPDMRARHRVGGFAVLENARRDPQRRKSWWLGAAAVLALSLLAQLVHKNRQAIAQGLGPLSVVVRALYGAVGAPLPAPANLSAYQLRQWGVTGDPDANGTLRLRASILNTAAQLQPYPLLRVTLADRFGKSIGRREFEPSEYVGKPTARLLAPGERVDASLAILDPGKNAEGFEIDVCLRGVDRKITCANDVAPQAKR
jgi:predicted Zn finger-like uncharacterized protein